MKGVTTTVVSGWCSQVYWPMSAICTMKLEGSVTINNILYRLKRRQEGLYIRESEGVDLTAASSLFMTILFLKERGMSFRERWKAQPTFRKAQGIRKNDSETGRKSSAYLICFEGIIERSSRQHLRSMKLWFARSLIVFNFGIVSAMRSINKHRNLMVVTGTAYVI